jgi:hypothetical protein
MPQPFLNFRNIRRVIERVCCSRRPKAVNGNRRRFNANLPGILLHHILVDTVAGKCDAGFSSVRATDGAENRSLKIRTVPGALKVVIYSLGCLGVNRYESRFSTFPLDSKVHHATA